MAVKKFRINTPTTHPRPAGAPDPDQQAKILLGAVRLGHAIRNKQDSEKGEPNLAAVGVSRQDEIIYVLSYCSWTTLVSSPLIFLGQSE